MRTYSPTMLTYTAIRRLGAPAATSGFLGAALHEATAGIAHTYRR